MRIADIEIRPRYGEHMVYAGAVLIIHIGALRQVRIVLSADMVRAVIAGLVGERATEACGDVSFFLALPPQLRKRGAVLTPESLNAREVVE